MAIFNTCPIVVGRLFITTAPARNAGSPLLTAGTNSHDCPHTHNMWSTVIVQEGQNVKPVGVRRRVDATRALPATVSTGPDLPRTRTKFIPVRVPARPRGDVVHVNLTSIREQQCLAWRQIVWKHTLHCCFISHTHLLQGLPPPLATPRPLQSPPPLGGNRHLAQKA